MFCYVDCVIVGDFPRPPSSPLTAGPGRRSRSPGWGQVTRRWNTFSYEIYEEEKRKKKILLYEDVPTWRVCTWRGRG